ncbi:major myo-inositol transporter IolT [Cutibacterium acnes JCM 18916]|nr:major myo-inositol transporter IolT [Cutibacterium acnes JCM 18916]GAE76198.1 major myo-inositol transporter IolT [Cutibacterium acnes JCM 18918]
MIVFGQLLAFSVNAAISAAHGGPSLMVTADPTGRLSPGTYSWDTLQAMTTSHGGAMTDQAFHAFLTQLSVSAGSGGAWRWMLVVCTLPAIALWIGMRKMPESARWHLSHGQLRETVACLKQVRVEGVDEPSSMRSLRWLNSTARAAGSVTVSSGRSSWSLAGRVASCWSGFSLL